ncbi:unnamed protein product [Nyctereutes procyonoides]|uniref:(raccoon dog) hypothetical protein n=1 Tax=Nyctereutes procyonoides TaxID=34880 RepID=A0A811Z3V4_NYCPR|nr:unnamed protein product [Nyctereutes procyonoides]
MHRAGVLSLSALPGRPVARKTRRCEDAPALVGSQGQQGWGTRHAQTAAGLGPGPGPGDLVLPGPSRNRHSHVCPVLVSPVKASFQDVGAPRLKVCIHRSVKSSHRPEDSQPHRRLIGRMGYVLHHIENELFLMKQGPQLHEAALKRCLLCASPARGCPCAGPAPPPTPVTGTTEEGPGAQTNWNISPRQPCLNVAKPAFQPQGCFSGRLPSARMLLTS